MITKNIDVTRVYDWLVKSDKRINVLRGGAGSSKSYSIAQHIVLNKLWGGSNRVIAVSRKTLPALKKTAYKLIIDLLKDYHIPYHLNKTDLELHVKDNICYFLSLDDPEKIQSLDLNDVWLEESTEFTLADYRQFNLRMRRPGENNQMFLSFNPVSALHWLKIEILDKRVTGIAEDHSTYKDNLRHLDETYIAELEDLINQDSNFHKIYALGEWGVLESLIYSFGTTDIPDSYDDISYGLDFGYNNPSAVMRVYWKDDRAVWEEVFYKSNLTNTDLIDEIKDTVPEDHLSYSWYADTAEPARIEEFYRAGFNIYGADKSVKDGIDFCKTHVTGITKNSPNAIKEKQSYSYKKDKDGNVLEDPVKFADHLMDAGRYGTYRDGMTAEPNIIILGE